MTTWPLPRGIDDTYLMHWPNLGFVKIGVSQNQRWRCFIPRGACPLVIVRGRGVQAVETAAHDSLVGVLSQAFCNKKAAAAHLGNQGGGYLECYLDDGSITLPALLDAAAAHAPDAELMLP